MANKETVAPLVGAWIEIQNKCQKYGGKYVAPLVGAWIEILLRLWFLRTFLCRSPRGSVD